MCSRMLLYRYIYAVRWLKVLYFKQTRMNYVEDSNLKIVEVILVEINIFFRKWKYLMSDFLYSFLNKKLRSINN